MKLSRIEKETIVKTDELVRSWDLCTANETLAKKWEKLGYEEYWYDPRVVTPYRFFKCPRRCVSFRRVKQEKRTEAQQEVSRKLVISQKAARAREETEPTGSGGTSGMGEDF